MVLLQPDHPPTAPRSRASVWNPWGRVSSDVQGVLLLVFGYTALGLLSLWMFRQSGGIALIWFANAWAVALWLSEPSRRLWTLALGVSGTCLLINWGSGDRLIYAAVYTVVNVMEVVLAVFLVRRWKLDTTAMPTPWQFFMILTVTSVVPPLISAVLAASMLALLGQSGWWGNWMSWFQGSCIGAMVTFLPSLSLVHSSRSQAWSALVEPRFLGALFITMGFTWWVMHALSMPFIFVVMLLVFWGVRFGLMQTMVLSWVAVLILSLSIAVGHFSPPPVQYRWQEVFVYLAIAATVLPVQVLSLNVLVLNLTLEKLRAGEDRLIKTNDGLEQFIRIASHDMREPINTVTQFTTLVLEEDELNPHSQRYLQMVQKAGLRMRSLIDDVLTFVRLQSEGQLELREVDLQGVLKDSVMMLSARIEGSQAQLTLPEGEMPAVVGQEGLLALVFQNLIGNALKFVRPGSPPVVHVKVRDDVNGPWVEVDVQDEGIGIRPDDLQRLFKPFTRLNLRKDFEGTGLGLAMTQHIVNAFGGELRVQSQLGAGSCFTVRLRKVAAAESLIDAAVKLPLTRIMVRGRQPLG